MTSHVVDSAQGWKAGQLLIESHLCLMTMGKASGILSPIFIDRVISAVT